MLKSMCRDGTALLSGHAAGVMSRALEPVPCTLLKTLCAQGALQPLSRCSGPYFGKVLRAQLPCRGLTLCLLPQQNTPDQRCLMLLCCSGCSVRPIGPCSRASAHSHAYASATTPHRDNPTDDPEGGAQGGQQGNKAAQEQDLPSILDQQPLRGCCCLMPFLLPLQETPDQRVAAVVDEVEEAQQQALSPELIRTPELPEGVPTLNVALIFGGAITTAGLSALSQTRMWLQSMEGLSRQLVGPLPCCMLSCVTPCRTLCHALPGHRTPCNAALTGTPCPCLAELQLYKSLWQPVGLLPCCML